MTSSSGLPSSSTLVLPRQIIPICDILDEKVDPQQLVNVIGLVRDFRPPVETRGAGKSAQLDEDTNIP